MHKRTYERLKKAIDSIETAKQMKGNGFAIPKEYKGEKIVVLTDRESFLEYTLNQVQNELIDETTMYELER